MKSTVRFNVIASIALSMLALSACESGAEEPSTTPEPEERSATRKALDELQRKYDELVEDRFKDTVEWATDDIENIGDWEYRVESLTFASTDELADQLNELGNEKWEVIWFEKTPDGFMAVLKRPSISYLSKIPLSQLGRIVVIGSDGQE